MRFTFVVSTWLGVESLVHVEQAGEAAREQTGHNQQCGAHADFETDEPAAQTQSAACFRGRVAARSQSGLRVVTREPPRRQHSEENAGQDRQNEGEQTGRACPGPLRPAAGCRSSVAPTSSVSRPAGEDHTENSARDREQQTLGEHLARTGARGSPRAPSESRLRARATPSARAGGWRG